MISRVSLAIANLNRKKRENSGRDSLLKEYFVIILNGIQNDKINNIVILTTVLYLHAA